MNTVIKYDKDWNKILNKVFDMVKTIPDTDLLAKNYQIDNLNYQEWVAISLFDGGFSSISYRNHWNNNCRILNRFYKLPEYRFENKKYLVSNDTLKMIQQQLDIAKLLGFDCAFMSRETKIQAFNHYKKYLPQMWHCPTEKYKMTDRSYQYIAWTPLNSNNLIMEK